ncbi:GNAT family N-acetyltransferase [Arenibacter sp. BSSL-BM3]|uniref:GNAT family N-acetyltransferase n=1 Tax=Arenibacter arenosicollis TaxID=2762274 RepID=A0ABR7QRS9_9FLAO|nr:GNAT family N-acetyltransferase [Arenibacter arenosicollis]MBC8769902.1 GNAT family N-acetyltransferase [Arenibacter arenosicollis]
MELINIGSDGRDFFKILPKDWQDIIVPIWEDYKRGARIYVFKNDGELAAGGIVFNGAPPNMTVFEIEEGQKYVELGFQYIGFLFVDPKYRNQALGSKWLMALKVKFPNQSYWLTIEEEGLRSFYEKNGFKCVTESKDPNNPEWILIYKP